MPTYRAIQLKGKGGLDQLQEIELPLMAPRKGEMRIRVRASRVGFTDIMKRARCMLAAGGGLRRGGARDHWLPTPR
jgi:NADPH:quinone reductase-like Zn-dependent oxidoreductase